MVGSGIAAQRPSPGNIGLDLAENAAATGAGLFTIILMFAPISGAHLNPVVSLVDAALGGTRWAAAGAYTVVQTAGCCCGVVAANLMFARSAVPISTKARASGPPFLSEIVATLGLMLVIFSLSRTGRGRLRGPAVGAYIAAAYVFTSSTSLANPAITVGRMLSDTFAGIAPGPVPSFVGAQLVGALLAIGLVVLLYPSQISPAIDPYPPDEPPARHGARVLGLEMAASGLQGASADAKLWS